VPATSLAADAARAAVSAAAALGVTGVEPAILADGANVIVHLAPSPLVAKVPASTAAVRPGIDAWLSRELDLAVFLTAADAPVMAPSAEVPSKVHHADGQAMSFWTYLRPSDAGRGHDRLDAPRPACRAADVPRSAAATGAAGRHPWYALYAERLPDCRQRAAELLASWRGP
jgi:hypothetical protein